MAKTRTLKTPQYKSFRLHKRIKPVARVPIPSTWKLLSQTVRHIAERKKLFGGIVLVYALLTIVFVWAGGSLLNTTELKSTLSESLGGANALATNLALFSLLLGNTAGGSGELGTTYQTIIVIITSLALIWAYRNTADTRQTVRIRDAFYKGAAPIVPFIIVLFIVGLQLLPLLVASFLFGTVTSGGLAVTAIEQVLWLLFFIACALLTLYMVSSSLFGLYIVTLPNMAPLRALRSARKLVLHRRLVVMRRLFIAVVLVFAAFAAIVLLAIYFVPVIAEWLFLAGTLVALPVAVGFVYKLYKALL